MIILLGVPRAGKTTWGKELAKTLNLPFYDLDTLVLNLTSSIHPWIDSVKTLVKIHGEKMLREYEKKALESLTYIPSGILALGGGTLLGDISLTSLFPKRFCLHLALPFEIFLERILKKELPASCNGDAGWYEGLKEFYAVRFQASLKASHETLNPCKITNASDLLGAIPKEVFLNLKTTKGD